MLLIADSGTSKTDWILADHGKESLMFRTPGLNPFFINEKEMVKILNQHGQDMFRFAADIKEIYFFGAGCSNPDRREVVSNALSHFFGNAFISVDSDLQGSVFATCGEEPGICCVIGTGSNIAVFDGEYVQSGQHGLGYILGDEGSGSFIGKQLITDFLYGHMPAEIHQQFDVMYKVNKENVVRNLYLKSGANFYLASFAKFLYEIKETEYGQKVIRYAFTQFVETHILTIEAYKNYPCHFVGSIAYFFEKELREVCRSYAIKLGKIMQKPIFELEKYVLSQQEV